MATRLKPCGTKIRSRYNYPDLKNSHIACDSQKRQRYTLNMSGPRKCMITTAITIAEKESRDSLIC